MMNDTKANETERSVAGHGRDPPVVVAQACPSEWRQKLRTRVVEGGIRAIWGKASFPATMATDVPLTSAALRMAWLRVLGACGVRQIVASSGLGHDFVCHIGDLAEYPYYHRRAFRNELAICAGWLCTEENPVVCDVGANVGFFATQLVQILQRQSTQVYAFEPVPTTFAKLLQSVQRLGLEENVHLIRAAVLDDARPVRLSYTDTNSLYAQVVFEDPNLRAGDRVGHARGVTLDDFCSLKGISPTLVKIDVEGYEAAVLRGARNLLARPDRPALMFEYFPEAQEECGVDAHAFHELLSGYLLYYIDDLEGQRMPLGIPVSRVEDVAWGCNLFAVPNVDGSAARWTSALSHAVCRLRGWS